MTTTINRLEIVGFMGANAEIRYMQNGGKVANFSIATTERWIDQNGIQQEKTDWHRITVYAEKTVSLLEQWGKKGRYVRVIAKLSNRKYTDKNGNEIYTTDYICREFNFMDAKPDDNTATNPTSVETTANPPVATSGEQNSTECPF